MSLLQKPGSSQDLRNSPEKKLLKNPVFRFFTVESLITDYAGRPPGIDRNIAGMGQRLVGIQSCIWPIPGM